ncbi:AAA family ATPase [Cryomorphaceae bacterium]|nr:AAA family ATPase [Cryomorphaceae bacterium]
MDALRPATPMADKLIYESKKSKIYFYEDSEWNKPVLLKLLNYEFPTPRDISQFYNEFDIIEGLGMIGTREALQRLKYKGKHAMYLEWVEGQTVKEAFQGKQEDIRDFLHLAVPMASAVAELHDQNIIHKDISGNNMIVNLQERWVKIIDFGIASKITLKEQHLGNPEHLDGTLEYLSPEQTGRMNRVIDYRTDLYSLGIVYYEMLCGRTPYQGLDAMGIVHGHIAVTPPSPSEVNPKVPQAISDIVMTLLAKESELRYQSAQGLQADLKRCAEEWSSKESIEPFRLKEQDYSGKFSLPQRLYGRDGEIEVLLQKFTDVAEGGLELVLVAGYSGTGKSALVHEVHKPITEKAGYFVEGKFDQYQRSVPYYALLQAFNEFIDILLSENTLRLDAIREQIREAVGEEGKVLTDVLPNLELVIGEQPEVPELGGSEAQNRFNYVFRKFVNAVSTEEHPVVVFIDDLQWADSSSLSLLKSLVTDSDNAYLLFIGAYRDNEVSPSHPFMIAVDDVRKTGAEVYDLHIGNLSYDHVQELVSDALNKDPKAVEDLCELVVQKTQGNAFFATQFLKSLYEDELLIFDRSEKSWSYNLARIQEKNITDNVVDFMAAKALKLPESTQSALKFAACFGNQFDRATLMTISEQSEEDTIADLQPALAEGLLLPYGDEGFKFAHDRIQQAVYSLIPEEERDANHLRIGRLLLQNADDQVLEDKLFDIVNQLNWGVRLIENEVERTELCELNLRAGIKAKESSAFKVAYDYFVAGIDLLSKDPWKNQYRTTLQLHALAGETAYLNGDFEQMNQMINTVIDRAEHLLEKVKSYEIKILAYKAENKLIEAINTGLELLAQLGEKFPKKPTMVHVMAALIKSKIQLRGKSNETLADLPAMTDENKIAAMRIIADIASSSYWATPTLFPLLMFRMVELSLKYGNTAVSAFAFATYGVIMCGVLGAMKSGYEYGKLGLILLEKYKAKEWKTQIYTPMYCLIVNWNEHIDQTLGPLQESYHIGLETGAIEFACVNTNIYCIHSYLSGKPLDRLEVETRSYSESFDQFKQETNFNYNEVYRQGMLNFMGQSKDPIVLTGDAYDEEKMMAQNQERNDQTGTFFLHFNKLILCYCFGEYEKAVHHAAESRKLLEAVLAKFEIPNHHFYEALTLLALYDRSTGAQKRKSIRRVRKTIRQMKKWAKDAPENFMHKYHLLKAELLRVRGRMKEAGLAYDEAIKGASQHAFTHEEAIAHELAGVFYIKQNSERLAEHYLKSAYNAYREWGAQAKLRALEQEHPNYVSGVHGSSGIGTLTTSGSSSMGRTNSMLLDMSTVIKASASITREIVLHKLLKNLMHIVMENAGADRGILLLKDGAQFKVQAQSDDSGSTVEILQGTDYHDSASLSESVVSYVIQSKKNAVVQDAKNDVRYTQCKYIKDSSVQSILSLPILNRGNLDGVLYLENNHATAAFTQDRIDLLALLSGQIAVSINNAILYENLEQKVTERTAELAAEKKKSDDLLLNILPLETAEELKRDRKTTPRHFDMVTVLFTDFKGFTTMSEQLSPAEIVDELGRCFGAFDKICDAHKIEKIKTIGDSYMCVGGLPVPNSTHAADAVKAALEMRDWIEEYKAVSKAQGKPIFEIRIGLHTGPVVAGVVGSKKFAYDIWGDTVNTAARMEASGEVGRVNISGSTFDAVKDLFECTYRGKIDAKHKGEVDMYFVETVNTPVPT